MRACCAAQARPGAHEDWWKRFPPTTFAMRILAIFQEQRGAENIYNVEIGCGGPIYSRTYLKAVEKARLRWSRRLTMPLTSKRKRPIAHDPVSLVRNPLPPPVFVVSYCKIPSFFEEAKQPHILAPIFLVLRSRLIPDPSAPPSFAWRRQSFSVHLASSCSSVTIAKTKRASPDVRRELSRIEEVVPGAALPRCSSSSANLARRPQPRFHEGRH